MLFVDGKSSDQALSLGLAATFLKCRGIEKKSHTQKHDKPKDASSMT